MASLSVAAKGIKSQCFAQIWWWWGREEQRLTGLWRQLLGVLAQATLCSGSGGTVCAEQETCMETYPHYSFSWQYLVLFSKCKFSSIRSCGSVSWAQGQVRVFGGVLTSSLPKDHLRSWSCPPEHIVSHPCASLLACVALVLTLFFFDFSPFLYLQQYLKIQSAELFVYKKEKPFWDVQSYFVNVKCFQYVFIGTKCKYIMRFSFLIIYGPSVILHVSLNLHHCWSYLAVNYNSDMQLQWCKQ